jgi:hypothetical protein
MNPKIKEIAIKAQVEHCISHVRLQEFAELIIRECSDKAHEFIIEDGDEFPKTSVAYRIKQHFGVEE